MGYCVYKHASPSGKVYVGITSMNPNVRWKQGEGYKNQIFYRAILKYGWDNIKHEILYSDLSKEEAEAKEIELIALYESNNSKFGYNISDGGYIQSEETKRKMSEGHKGKSHSKETCEKLSKIASGRTGELNPFYGKHHSENAKSKISKANKNKKSYWSGKHLPEETRKKISEAAKLRIGEKNGFYGKKHSEETKQKMKEIWKRRKEEIV